MSTGRRLHPALGTAVLLLVYPLAAGLCSVAALALGGEDMLSDPDFVTRNLAAVVAAPWLIAIPVYVYFGGWLTGVDSLKSGLKSSSRWRWLAAGLVHGVLLVLIPATAALLLGGYQLLSAADIAALSSPTGTQAAPLLPTLCIAFLVAALGEELVCRGLLLRYWQPTLGTRGAVVLSSLLFTAMHSFNTHLSLAGFIGILLAGLLLGAVYIGSGSLWLVTGLHAGWNLSISIVLGLPVSGLSVPAWSRWQVADSAAAKALLGGEFGPEEGLAYQGFLLLFTAVVWGMRRRKSGN